MKNKKRGSERTFFICAVIITIAFALFCVMPIILVISASLTDEQALIRDGYRFIPEELIERMLDFQDFCKKRQ